MSVIARFEVIPVRDGSMSDAIAAALRALDQYPVSYRTTATDTIIEADSVETIFAAVQAAHRAIPEDRVITSIEVDEDRRRPQDSRQRVASVERKLGHPPQRERPPQGSAPAPQGQPGQGSQPTRQSHPRQQSQPTQQTRPSQPQAGHPSH